MQIDGLKQRSELLGHPRRRLNQQQPNLVGLLGGERAHGDQTAHHLPSSRCFFMRNRKNGADGVEP